MAKTKDAPTTEEIPANLMVQTNENPSVLVVRETQELAVPDFMQEDSELGKEDLTKYIKPPRLKVVQRNADEQYRQQFDAGDVILIPQMVLVAAVKRDERDRPVERGTAFAFVPLLFFPEWITVNPMAYKGSEPFIRDRSLDPKSEIAFKAQSPETWEEPHPTRPKTDDGKDAKIRHQECLNFVVVILGVAGLEAQPVVMSFSKTAHRTGSNLAMLINMRRNAPIFGCVFEAHVEGRKNAKGEWLGLAVGNPAETGFGPTITNARDYQALKTLHYVLKGRILVDYEDIAEDLAANGSGEDKF